jgi:hypothetical protein
VGAHENEKAKKKCGQDPSDDELSVPGATGLLDGCQKYSDQKGRFERFSHDDEKGFHESISLSMRITFIKMILSGREERQDGKGEFRKMGSCAKIERVKQVLEIKEETDVRIRAKS